MKKKIVYVVGTRPEFIRSAFIIKALKKDPEINFQLVHTGQHYSHNMNKIFFPELELPDPDINLDVGSDSHARQTAEIMEKFEDYLIDCQPDVVAVFGDTNSTLATTLTAVKLKIKTAHLEAGCREWEMDIPEEINRIAVDHICSLLLPVSQVSYNNLIREKVRGRVILIGDPLFDVYKSHVPKTNLKQRPFSHFNLLTLHRDKNVDDIKKLKKLLALINNLSLYPVIYPSHPRTMDNLKRHKVSVANFPNIKFIEPVAYQETLNLVKNCEIVITDSGGLQKEAFWSEKLCITLRNHTAWEETVKMGVNFVTTYELEKIESVIKKVIANKDKYGARFKGLSNPYYQKNSLNKTIRALKYLAS